MVPGKGTLLIACPKRDLSGDYIIHFEVLFLLFYKLFFRTEKKCRNIISNKNYLHYNKNEGNTAYKPVTNKEKFKTVPCGVIIISPWYAS